MLAAHVEKSLNKTQCFESKIDCPLHEAEGMTGVKTRHLYNNLCSLELPDRSLKYLEVGSYTGSSLCAALYKNPHVTAWAYDNFSEFDGPIGKFSKNVERFIPDANLFFKEEDFFKADLSELENQIDIYLYDGPHTRSHHHDAIVKAWPVLAPESIVIVDDWNWPEVRDGTYQGFLEVGARVGKAWEIRHTWDNTHTPVEVREREFWNGIAIFIISK